MVFHIFYHLGISANSIFANTKASYLAQGLRIIADLLPIEKARNVEASPSPKPKTSITSIVVASLLGLFVMLVGVVLLIVALIYPSLPSLDVLIDYRPKIPLRIYANDGSLLGEFGEERRALIAINDVPSTMKQAILAAEDDRFYQHGGIDVVGLTRAALTNLVTGQKRQGASTITQQVAKNFFLSSEKTYSRKLYEILLSFKIEKNLSKDQILELYVNQIFLGQRAYGFAAAAQIYFGKPLKDLSLAETAMLAGLPKAPSAFNPVVNPKRARLRQQYVLRRMHELHFIDDAQYQQALNDPLVVKRDANDMGIHAEYVMEMARQIAANRFPDEVYTRGLKVYTTINREEQITAYQALRRGVLDYDRRHGYRGAESYVDLSDVKNDQDESLDVLLQDVPDIDDLIPVIVLSTSNQGVKAYRRGGEVITIPSEGLRFAQSMLSERAPPNKRIKRGAVIRVQQDDKGRWSILQLPEVEAAFMAASPEDGSVRALVGGFDFGRNKFNHVTQGWRQPGSSFKPFIYSAALDKNFTPTSIIADEPISISSGQTGGQVWEPKNYDGNYEGPMKLRTALAKSKNMVSIRILQSIGTGYAQEFATRFGFDAEKHPPYLTMALGAGSVTQWQMVRAYSVFANGGYRIEPYVVKNITDDKGNVLAQFSPPKAGDENMRVLDPRNAFLMDDIMRDVTSHGTAARASAVLKRKDIAGKTGTTNEYLDAWFCGYHVTVVGCAWMGFDQPRKLGDKETGGAAALPIWISFMNKALQGVPETYMQPPEGLTQKGKQYYYSENVPADPPPRPPVEKSEGDGGGEAAATPPAD